MSMIGYYRVTVRGNGKVLPAGVTIHFDNGDAYSSGPFDKERQTVQVDFNKSPRTFGADLIIECDGYKTYDERLLINFDEANPNIDLPDVTLIAASLIESIHVEDNRFITASGKEFIWKMNTDFRLFKKYIEGEDIDNILNARKQIGSNGVRVLGMAFNLFHLNPIDYLNYYTYLNSFVKLVAEHGMYVEYVAFADLQLLKLDKNHHWNEVKTALAGEPNVFIELANEYEKNGVNPYEFDCPTSIISSQGSNMGDGTWPPKPGWNYHTWHGRRDYKSIFSSCEDLYNFANGIWPGFKRAPAVQNEPIKFGYDEEANPSVAYKIGITSALYGNGCTFHFVNGLQSENMNDVEIKCAQEMYRGLNGQN